jgi:hypothetical protein
MPGRQLVYLAAPDAPPNGTFALAPQVRGGAELASHREGNSEQW